MPPRYRGGSILLSNEATRRNGRARGGHWPLLLSQILNEVVRRRLTNSFGTSEEPRSKERESSRSRSRVCAAFYLLISRLQSDHETQIRRQSLLPFIRFSLFFQTLAGGQWFSVALASLLFNLIRLHADALLRSPVARFYFLPIAYRLAAALGAVRSEFAANFTDPSDQFYASRVYRCTRGRSPFSLSLSLSLSLSVSLFQRLVLIPNNATSDPLCHPQSMITESAVSRGWFKRKLNEKRENSGGVSANSEKSDSCCGF